MSSTPHTPNPKPDNAKPHIPKPYDHRSGILNRIYQASNPDRGHSFQYAKALEAFLAGAENGTHINLNSGADIQSCQLGLVLVLSAVQHD